MQSQIENAKCDTIDGSSSPANQCVEIAEQRTRFESALCGVTDAVIVTDPQALITFMNPAAEKLTGWMHQEALKKPLGEVFHILDEHLRTPIEGPVPRAIRDGLIRGLAGLTMLVSYDGSQRPIDDSAAPILDDAGDTIGVVLIFRTVTTRYRAKKRLEVSEIRLPPVV